MDNLKKIGEFGRNLFKVKKRRKKVINFEFTDEDLDTYMYNPISRRFFDENLDNTWKKEKLSREIDKEIYDMCDKIEKFASNEHVTDVLVEINEAEKRNNVMKTFGIGFVRHSILFLAPVFKIPVIRNIAAGFIGKLSSLAPFVVERFPKIVRETIADRKLSATENTIKLYDKLVSDYNKANPDEKVETSKATLNRLREKYVMAHEVYDRKTRRILENEFDSRAEAIFRVNQERTNTKVVQMAPKVERHDKQLELVTKRLEFLEREREKEKEGDTELITQNESLKQENLLLDERNELVTRQNKSLKQENLLLNEQNKSLKRENLLLDERNELAIRQNKLMSEHIRLLEEQMENMRMAQNLNRSANELSLSTSNAVELSVKSGV
ncbi:MAG: hypothetical protein LBB24_03720 [Rickettsiales bacterium]|nr:hypothetical protein [Rickettsiales bacterium]